MCGRFANKEPSWAKYHESLNVIHGVESDVSFNIKPTQTVPIAYIENGELLPDMARWWLVPNWFKKEPSEWKATTFNAKIETAFEKPTFRASWKYYRCIIPASGYFEWTGEKGHKQPWHIQPNQNAPVFFFAGLFSRLPSGLNTCTILTRPAAPEIAELHHRMPVMLKNVEIESWLSHQNDTDQTIADLGTSWESGFAFHKVAPFGIKDNGPEVIEPFEG